MASGGTSGSEVSERQKYDDEKRRITDSCFSKTDETGAGMSAATRSSFPYFGPALADEIVCLQFWNHTSHT